MINATSTYNMTLIILGGGQDKDREIHDEVLSELNDILTDRLPSVTRQKLINYLRGRIENVADPVKRASAVNNIAKKLGDTNYWIDYATRI